MNDAGATYREWNNDSELSFYSIDGAVNITSFTKTKIIGTFEFNAKPNSSSQLSTIKEGKFTATIGGVSGEPWNGL